MTLNIPLPKKFQIQTDSPQSKDDKNELMDFINKLFTIQSQKKEIQKEVEIYQNQIQENISNIDSFSNEELFNNLNDFLSFKNDLEYSIHLQTEKDSPLSEELLSVLKPLLTSTQVYVDGLNQKCQERLKKSKKNNQAFEALNPDLSIEEFNRAFN